jgi:hypothetical protein
MKSINSCDCEINLPESTEFFKKSADSVELPKILKYRIGVPECYIVLINNPKAMKKSRYQQT